MAEGRAAEQMRQAIAELQEGLRRMDVQTGVLQDQLWHMRMQSGAASAGRAPSPAAGM